MSGLPEEVTPSVRRVVPAVGPRLRYVLLIVFGLVATLMANSAYLSSVTLMQWWSGQAYENHFYQYMFLLHVALGLLLIVPFVLFGALHMKVTRHRRNRRAVKIGYVLFVSGIIVLVTGLALIRQFVDLKDPRVRSIIYWAHVVFPLIAVWLYCLHRLAGRRIKWRVGGGFALATIVLVVIGLAVQSQDPRKWNQAGPEDGGRYFEPSLARTPDDNWIPAKALMNDEYCLQCHADAYKGWFHSVHHLSSFNNPAYLASIRETREVMLKRDGDVKASRWCAGCHDPVPLFSGAFDDPDYDMVRHPTSQAGITCTVCHAMTHVNSTKGNADYVIEEPLHYPFAYSKNKFLQSINHMLVKAKPSFHKRTFLKPFHKSAEFCATCHKVHLPKDVTHYKEFLRGQNHYDNFLLSGVSGHGLRSFYYPEKAQPNCNECHMPLIESGDFGARVYAGDARAKIHDHTFLGANTAMAWWKEFESTLKAHQEFLKDCVRVDLFGVRKGDAISDPLIGPLRPDVPELQPGQAYLFEAVIRTLRVGHLFTQGTTDSNEVWLEVTVTSGDQVIGSSGALDENREVDRWAHFVNVFMLDRHGNRISRRNAQDIFVPLYNHQIPPGAAQTVHYGFTVPEGLTEPVRVKIALKYRKFDKQYTDFVGRSTQDDDLPLRGHQVGEPYSNQLPITTLAEDQVTFGVAGQDHQIAEQSHDVAPWERWNDYGIGLLLKGKFELRQAIEAFDQVELAGKYHGPLNLARAYFEEGSRLDEAVDALLRAKEYPDVPLWTVFWLQGVVNRQQGHVDDAIEAFEAALSFQSEETVRRGFDFSKDYEVINLLGLTLFDRAQQEINPERKSAREALLRRAVEQYQKTLKLDEENVSAHYNLQLIHSQLGNTDEAERHRKLHQRYKLDDNARGAAVAAAREKYPAANRAAQDVVIYLLQRDE